LDRIKINDHKDRGSRKKSHLERKHGRNLIEAEEKDDEKEREIPKKEEERS